MAQRQRVAAGDSFSLVHNEVFEQRVAGDIAEQHRLQADAASSRTPRLGDRGGRRWPERVIAALDPCETVVHGRDNRRT